MIAAARNRSVRSSRSQARCGRTAAGRASRDGRPGRPRPAPAPCRRSAPSARPGAGTGRRADRPLPRAGERRPARGVGVPAQPELGQARHRGRARVAGSTFEAVSRWANGLRSLPTPIRPSAQAWSGVVPRPENGSRTTSPGPRIAGDEGVRQSAPGSSRGTSTSDGRNGPTGAAGPSIRARSRWPAARPAGPGPAVARRWAFARESVRPSWAERSSDTRTDPGRCDGARSVARGHRRLRPPPMVPSTVPCIDGWAHGALVAYPSRGSEDHAEPSDGPGTPGRRSRSTPWRPVGARPRPHRPAIAGEGATSDPSSSSPRLSPGPRRAVFVVICGPLRQRDRSEISRPGSPGGRASRVFPEAMKVNVRTGIRRNTYSPARAPAFAE